LTILYISNVTVIAYMNMTVSSTTIITANEASLSVYRWFNQSIKCLEQTKNDWKLCTSFWVLECDDKNQTNDISSSWACRKSL